LGHFAEGNKDADRSVDSPRWREPIIFPKEEHALMHEARITREINLELYDQLKMMKYLSMFPSMVATIKSSMCSV
jgi:hypothetical protein